MLKVCDLEKKLQNHLVLHQLNMDIEDRCIYGLIGENGAGKSTLLRVLAGVYECDHGCVMIDDQDLHKYPEKKAEILLIQDEPFYFHHATLSDMKHFYQIAHPDLDEAYYHKLITVFELDDRQPLYKFSKGMKRQAFLILGLCIAPRYLLLDEAFDGLDPHMRMMFKKEISERIEEKKMSVIISSHNLKEMEELCDCFGILENGKLLTSGSVSDKLHEVHRFQLAFAKPMDKEDFSELKLLSLQITASIVNLVAEGEEAEIKAFLKEKQPIMMEMLPVSLEEIFVFKMLNKTEVSQ
ncbi:ABC transporter ATP-binding protein [bacterium c-19]|nr:ABC transporter ATP-binding protein [bacterium c-19]